MAYAVPQLTDYGMSMLVRAVGGETITFTRMAIGNGDIPAGAEPTSLNNLINEQLSFGIASIEAQDAYNVRIIARFDSTQIQNDFRWKEIGVFCVGEKTQSFSGNSSTKTFTITDKPSSLNYVTVSGIIVTISSYNSVTGEVTLASAPALGTNNVMVSYPDYEHEKLYAYSNDGNNAGMLKANASDVTAEQSLALIIEVGRASSVTAIISPSVLYVQQAEFDAHLKTTNPHKISKSTIGLENVPNVTTNNQTPTYSTPFAASNLISGETISTAFGKIARAVMDLISHISNKNNPHGDTPASIGAATAEHSHSTADITTGTLGVQRGGTGRASFSQGSILKGNGNGPLSSIYGIGALYAAASGQPVFGILPESLGGTGSKSLEEAGIFKVVTGVYNGTGEYGSTHETSLTFSRTPQLILVMPTDNTKESTYGGFLAINGVKSLMSGGINDDVANTRSKVIFTWNNTTVSWYATDAKYQQNSSELEYSYFAILK